MSVLWLFYLKHLHWHSPSISISLNTALFSSQILSLLYVTSCILFVDHLSFQLEHELHNGKDLFLLLCPHKEKIGISLNQKGPSLMVSKGILLFFPSSFLYKDFMMFMDLERKNHIKNYKVDKLSLHSS